MPQTSENNDTELPRSAHFVGVGGVGMSAVAAAYAWMGVKVSGSDRKICGSAESLPSVFGKLKDIGVELFPQDGSFATLSKPELIVVSSAVEEDNPDLVAAAGIARLHRSKALAAFLAAHDAKTSIAVCGTSGKTTTTAWLAETLNLMGEDPVLIGGGVSRRFKSGQWETGNFKSGSGKFIVFEADESDKSLLNITPGATVLLNIGTDHHDESELARMFDRFTSQTECLAAESAAAKAIGLDTLPNADFAVFKKNSTRSQTTPSSTWRLAEYSPGKATMELRRGKNQKSMLQLKIPQPGRHSAMNALAVLAMVDALGLDIRRAIDTIPKFKGVERRLIETGQAPSGAKVFDDYAHNPDKIRACLEAVRESLPAPSGKIVAIFQPHGFKPLEFMREQLFHALEKTLGKNDLFVFLPVHYAGGSASFSPTASEVAETFSSKGEKHYAYALTRDIAREILAETTSEDAIVVMGARDDSLAQFAASLACHSPKKR